MPGKIKVRILAGRNLPVMDRSSDTSDAFVEVKFGNTTFKTDVYRKSLNPHWNTDWFKFEAEDEELQDETIQIRVMDHDTYSANDAIGKIFINLKPLLNRDPAVMCGWFPIFDTMHGIRGELQAVIKLELFSDFNRFRSSSCGVKIFFCPSIPEGYILKAIQGFVEELIVNDDPEYQWIDKIRTPRASNEARQMLLWKLAGEVQRKIGLKVLELGGNAIVGYIQNFDFEGESGIVLRCIGTSVTLIKDTTAQIISHSSSSHHKIKDNSDSKCLSPKISHKFPHAHSPAKSVHSTPLHKTSESEFCLAQRTCSLSGNAGSGVTKKPIPHFPFNNQDGLDISEYPFITMKSFPSDFIEHIGGIVSAKSVKLLDRSNSIDEPETRDCWWTEIRMEIRSHAKALGCNVVIGYHEKASFCDDVCILSVYGTAAILNVHVMCNSMSAVYQQNQPKDDIHDYEHSINESCASCSICHIPYSESSVPFPTTLTKCLICKTARVPDVLFTTIEPFCTSLITGKGCLIQARVVRPKRDIKSETSAKEISDCLPFLEYELHRQLITKLKLKGMNALFGLEFQVSIGEKLVIGLATGTGVLLSPLSRPLMPQLPSTKMMAEKELHYVQEKMAIVLKKNKEIFALDDRRIKVESPDLQIDTKTDLDLSIGNKDAFVLEVDDSEDSEILSILKEPRCPPGYEICNTETIPGINLVSQSIQIFTRIWRMKFPMHDVRNEQLSSIFEDLLRTIFFKVRNAVPCGIINLQFQVDLPEEDEIQIIICGMLVNLNQPHLHYTKDAISSVKKTLITSHSGSLNEKGRSAIGFQLNRTLSVVQPSSYNNVIELSSLNYIPNGYITEYVGNLSFCLIRECTDVREYGNLSGFMQSFMTEVLAIARAHVSALGVNALISMKLSESVIQHNLHKNQGQSIFFCSGDAVLVEYNR